MDPFVLQCVRAQVKATLDEIDQLEGSEFPYANSKDALLYIRKLFKDHLDDLNHESTDQSLVDYNCVSAFRRVEESIDVLGFVLRSTNVRNAFEMYGPLLRVAKEILGSDKKLLTSSEWYFSPFTYIGHRSLSSDYVLIGLPATESSNPFLLPLAGHELGHSIWHDFDYDAEFGQIIADKIVEKIKTESWDEYQELFPGQKKRDLNSDLSSPFVSLQKWEPAWDWAMRQSEETFCDFVGLRIFGESFLYAFAYLLAPARTGERSFIYPNNKSRVHALLQATSHYGLTPPNRFLQMFADLEEPDDSQTRLLLSIADSARKEVSGGLAFIVDGIVSLAGINPRSPADVRRCKKTFALMVPAQKSAGRSNNLGGLANILNAAWEAYITEDFFTHDEYNKEKLSNLREIVLKSIEVFEIELRKAERRLNDTER